MSKCSSPKFFNGSAVADCACVDFTDDANIEMPRPAMNDRRVCFIKSTYLRRQRRKSLATGDAVGWGWLIDEKPAWRQKILSRLRGSSSLCESHSLRLWLCSIAA